MRRTVHDVRIPLVLAALVALAALPLAGCRGGNPPRSELDRILAPFRALPADVREDSLRAFLRAHPDQARFALFELGNLYYQRAGKEKVEPGPNSVTGVNALLDSAVTFFEAAMTSDSTFVEPIVNLGLVWDDLSEGNSPQARRAMNRARELYTAAIALRPTDEIARCNLAALEMRLRRYPEALKHIRAVLAADPHSALAHYNLAIMFAETKIYREARREWELAVKYDPDGDIGNRSRENLKVIDDLMHAKVPDNLEQPAAGSSRS